MQIKITASVRGRALWWAGQVGLFFFSAWRGIADRYKKGLVFLLRPARATQIQRQKNEAHGKRLGTRCPKK